VGDAVICLCCSLCLRKVSALGGSASSNGQEKINAKKKINL
jgi:hypothetical protein